MLKKQVRRVAGLKADLAARRMVRQLAEGDYRVDNVPYQCQFASPSLVKAIIETGASDPSWKVFGYKTEKEASYWASRQCGIACVKMVLEQRGVHATVAELTKQGVALGGYDVALDRGWYYAPLVRLLGGHEVSSRVVTFLTINTVAAHVATGGLVIASVNPEIIRGDTVVTSHKKSGHLVLVTGCKKTNGKLTGFYIHNPSGKSIATQVNTFIPLEVFRRSFGERGICID